MNAEPQSLLRGGGRDAEVVKELKDVCLHTLQTEEKPEVVEP